MIHIALALAAAQALSHDKQPIPEVYQGVWALDAKYCADGGEAVVDIGPRIIDFYERHGYLDLAQINEGTDPPEFYGNFRWVELLHFSQGVVRLRMVGDKLHITEADDPNAPMNPAAWTKCPPAGQQ